MNVEERLQSELKNFKSAPFLFIGSGFSRRYLGLEDWKGMLKKFCVDNIKHFEYYYSMANSSLPKTASLMSKDFSERWWTSEDFEKSRKEYKKEGEMTNESSPLKYEISKYLKGCSTAVDPKFNKELEDFSKVIVDGIITTNWDTLVDNIFTEYDIYIGQSDLINSNVQQVGEIYKIHGSVTDYNSLVLTQEDYNDFNNRNAYLSAKLLAIFMEHPIVFIGYSISDENIKEILQSISFCINKDGLKKLQNSLFFVEPIFDNSDDMYEKSYINIDHLNLPVTIIKAKDYSNIYKPLQMFERKLSVKQMKQIKSQLYTIVRDNDPENRIGLIDIDETTDYSDVDFVLGIGVKSLHNEGLVGLEFEDFIEDIVLDNRGFCAQDIIEKSMPKVLIYQYRTPYYKYLRLGSYIDQSGNIKDGLSERIYKYADRIKEESKGHALKKLRKERPDIEYTYDFKNPNILKYQILRDGKSSINIEKLEQLLKENFNYYVEGDTQKVNPSNYRTIVRIYDWIKYS